MKEETLKLRNSAEHTCVEFKVRVTGNNRYDVNCRATTLSNSRGGMIVVGIYDKTGCMNSLLQMEAIENVEREFEVYIECETPMLGSNCDRATNAST